jgi:hypothetical protein
MGQYLTARELDVVQSILDLFRAGLSVVQIAQRLGLTPGNVRRELKRWARPLWAEPEPPQPEEQARCIACGILLCAAWTSWDADGLCDDCQTTLGVLMQHTGLPREQALELWLMPTPLDPAESTALERYLEGRN